MDLLVVILHYGREELTRRLHRQLLESDPQLARNIRVFDNHAPEPYPDAWLRADENLYWAGALARCAELAVAEGFGHLWFLNNDLYFISPGPHVARAWGRMQAAARLAGPVGIYSPAQDRNPYHPQMLAGQAGGFRQVALVDGIAPLIDLTALREVGGVDYAGNPYGYGVDLMLSLAMARAGRSLVVDRQVVARHAYHATARRVEGFMAMAAAAEQRYLLARLGPGYPAVLEGLKAQGREF